MDAESDQEDIGGEGERVSDKVDDEMFRVLHNEIASNLKTSYDLPGAQIKRWFLGQRRVDQAYIDWANKMIGEMDNLFMKYLGKSTGELARLRQRLEGYETIMRQMAHRLGEADDKLQGVSGEVKDIKQGLENVLG